MNTAHIAAAIILSCALAACQRGDPGSSAALPGDANSREPYSEIAVGETLHFTGTEPFWGGEVTGGALTYETPENAEGTTISVERFPGRGGLSFSGRMDGQDFLMAVTPGDCSDGMSNRRFPFVVTLQIGETSRNGCAYSDRHPFTGPEHP